MNLILKQFYGQCLKINLIKTLSFYSSSLKIFSSYCTSSVISDSNKSSSLNTDAKVENNNQTNQDIIKGLMEFFDNPKNWGEKEVKTGRAWKMEELRIKSNSDLHKLWYVLLKEKNMLLTMQEECKRVCSLFPSPERIDKVEESMKNLENVIRERNRSYLQLEVSEQETGDVPHAFRRDTFGRYRWISCSEHFIPYQMNTKWRNLWGPGKSEDVHNFYCELKEIKISREIRKLKTECFEVRSILRRFPNVDLDYLQKKYPRVPVQYFKDNLAFYPEYKPLLDRKFSRHLAKMYSIR